MASNSLRRSSDPPQLPFDVYGLIVDEVAADRELRPSLKNLSLAQGFLKPLCQQHLYNTLAYRMRNIEKLTFLSNVSPHLIAYIRRFYYQFSGNDSIVVQFIQRLRGINSFSFSSDLGLDFRALDPPLTMAILGLLRSPDLRWLSLHKIYNYPIGHLLHLGNAPNLRYLEIQDLPTDDVAVHVLGSNAPSAPLSNIHIYLRASQAVALLLGGPMSPVFDFSSLRELTVESESQADVNANKLLIQACNYNRLEVLSCTLEEEADMHFEGFADSILSGPAQTLRSLHFWRPIPWITPEDEFCGIAEEIKQLSDSHKLNVLESLKITLGIYNAEPTAVEAKRICGDTKTWAANLDAVFGEDSGFPSLPKVSIWVFVSCVPHREYKYNKNVRAKVNKIYKATVRKIAQECFDNLSGHNLHFNFQMDIDWDLSDWNLGR